jgi:hypothetical protein
MTATRVYKLAPTPERLLSNKETKPRFVSASNQAQAYRHVALTDWTASVATQDDLIEYVGKVPIEKASEE